MQEFLLNPSSRYKLYRCTGCDRNFLNKSSQKTSRAFKLVLLYDSLSFSDLDYIVKSLIALLFVSQMNVQMPHCSLNVKVYDLVVRSHHNEEEVISSEDPVSTTTNKLEFHKYYTTYMLAINISLLYSFECFII